MVDLFFIPLQLQRLILELCNALVELDAFGRSGGGKAVLRHLDLRAVALLLLVDIIGAHACKQVGAVAVQIDQRLEAVLFARGKEPVDRALLVDFAVILIKIVQEVFADHLACGALAAERVGNKAQVFFQRVLAVNLAHKVHEQADDVVVKVIIIADGDDIVAVD